MKYTIKGKNTTITQALEEKITEKFARIEKLLPENSDINITLDVVKLTHKIEVTVIMPKRILRAEIVSDDMYAAIDGVIDKLERQIVKHKKRLRDKSRRDSHFKYELEMFRIDESTDNSDDTEKIKIEKVKKFDIKPMNPEEAVLEMELLSHNFFVFRNDETDEINVVYKRHNGTYGIIEQE